MVCHDPGGLLMIVLPVIHALIIGQCHIHIRGVADILVIYPRPGLDGMQRTGTVTALLLRLIQAHQQQRQKRHIVAEGQPGTVRMLLPDPAADSAIDRVVTPLLLLAELRAVCGYKAEHSTTPLMCFFHHKTLL